MSTGQETGGQPSAPVPPAETDTATATGPATSRLQTDVQSGTVVIACPSCAGQQTYTPEPTTAAGPSGGTGADAQVGAGRLVCGQCGTERIVEFGGLVATRPLDPALAAQPAADARTGEELDKQLLCPNCGGQVAFVGTLATAACPFCGAQVQQSDIRNAPGRIAIDGIIPLRIPPAQAEAAIETWVKRQPLGSRSYYKPENRGPLQTVYLPYVLVNADIVTEYEGKCAREVYETVVGTRYSEWEPVAGTVKARLYDTVVPADSSAAMFRPESAKSTLATEFADAVPFQPELLAGALCRTPDRNLNQILDIVRRDAEWLGNFEVAKQVGASETRFDRRETSLHDATYRQILLPVHSTTIMCDGKPHHIWVHGVSGKIEGDEAPSRKAVSVGIPVVLVLLIAALFIGSALFGW